MMVLCIPQVEVGKAQDAIVPVKMPEMDDSFRTPDIHGNGMAAANTEFPVQVGGGAGKGSRFRAVRRGKLRL